MDHPLIRCRNQAVAGRTKLSYNTSRDSSSRTAGYLLQFRGAAELQRKGMPASFMPYGTISIVKNDRILRIYTDGGCSGNQNDENIGGWGAILEFAGHRKELYGGELNTTNNRMEMTALLEALKAIKKEKQIIHVYSDSSYLMDCFRKKWYVNWQKNGWKNAQKKPVENQDLWKALLPFLEQHSISFFRVKGHVNLNSKATNFDNLYQKFLEWNGSDYSFEDFQYVTEQNNRADELANIAMDELR